MKILEINSEPDPSAKRATNGPSGSISERIYGTHASADEDDLESSTRVRWIVPAGFFFQTPEIEWQPDKRGFAKIL